MLVLPFILLASVNCFLLDNHQGNGGKATTNQNLTLSKLYEEMKLHEQKTTLLDNSLTLLTSQLQHKFDLLDKKLAEVEKQNKTIVDTVNLKQKYIQLEQKYLNLEHNYTALKMENNVLRNDRDRMENEMSSLRNETNQELAGLKNKSLLVDKNIENLKQLGSIKPLENLKMLQQEVKSISAQTSSLNMKEQARSQDFIALYSKVQKQEANSSRSMTNLGNQLKTLQTNHNASITDLGTQLKIFQKNQNTFSTAIEAKMHEATIRFNQTFIRLQQETYNSTRQVLMTAHPSTFTTKSGIIKFDNVAFSVGINNLPAFKSTGKFVCENDGTYLISTSIASSTIDANYVIYLNGNAISTTFIGYNHNKPSLWYYTGSVVLVLPLRSKDSVWVHYPNSYNIYNGLWSTFTIVKI